MTKYDPKRPKYNGSFSIDHRERESHARGAYPTQDTSRMGTARLKYEEAADTRIIVKSSMKYGRKERGYYKGDKSQTRPN